MILIQQRNCKNLTPISPSKFHLALHQWSSFSYPTYKFNIFFQTSRCTKEYIFYY